MVALADNLFDLTGPVDAVIAEVLQDQMRQRAVQIKGIDPAWLYDEIVRTDALGLRIGGRTTVWVAISLIAVPMRGSTMWRST